MKDKGQAMEKFKELMADRMPFFDADEEDYFDQREWRTYRDLCQEMFDELQESHIDLEKAPKSWPQTQAEYERSRPKSHCETVQSKLV